VTLSTFAELFSLALGVATVVLTTVENVAAERARGSGSERRGPTHNAQPATAPEPAALSLLAVGLVAGAVTPSRSHPALRSTPLGTTGMNPVRDTRGNSEATVQHWIDTNAGLAHISVGGQLNAFREFLDAIEQLISHPDWQPGMPVVEDLRQCYWIPPPPAIEEWRAYVAKRQPALEGCRWAVVTGGSNPIVVSILGAATKDAAPKGVILKQFKNLLDAHLWVKPPVPSSPA
jgi:hypothetical protein